MPYRESRNIEISTKDYIKTQINASWTGINVFRSFGEVTNNNLPAICVRLGKTLHDNVEIGAPSTIRTATIFVDIFANDDGQRLDLKDFLIEKLKGEWDYHEYTVNNGVSSDIINGKIRRVALSETEVSPAKDKSQLSKVDRYRHLITVTVTTGKVEV
ncbi:MAG: hypothetical protein DRJ38_05450 [Thermoprotei archaeon]|nr:MAG: hypothetical protein DRJ38_05450 [Thermoprotei archaeon]